MDEENRKTLPEEALASVTIDILTPKSKSNDVVAPKSRDTSHEIKSKVEIFDEKDFVWGIKQSGNKYKTVTIKNELYALNDCVRCRSGLELDYIGKIMKLSQENDQKVCTLRWFFRPFELPTSLKEIYTISDTRELFLAFGEGIGVENKNLLVSCYNISNIRSFYNVENVVSLEVIIGKCKVLCIAKDDFNDLPSSEHLNMCDFFFNKAFDCDTLKIVGLDGVVDAIGAQKVYNKKEWLNWNKHDMHSISMTSSPQKTLRQSFSSYTMPTNSSDINILPRPHYNSSPSITEQSTRKSLIEKRKRDSLEKVILSQKMMKKIKKIKLSPTSKNPKLSTIVTLIKQEDQATKTISEVKSAVTIVDALNTHTLSSGPIQCKGSQPTFDEMLNTSFENDKIDGNSKSYTNLLVNATMILEQTTEGVGNNADDIHVTCEGFPMESFLEPVEKSESSTSKLKKDESNSKLVIAKNGTSEIGIPPNSKKSKATLAKERKKASKVVQKYTSKKSSNFIIDTILKEPAKRNSAKSNFSKKIQNKRKKVMTGKIEDQILDTSHSHDSQKPCKDLMKKNELTYEDQQPVGSPLVTIEPTMIGENLSNKESCENLPTSDNVTNTSIHIVTIPLEQKFEFKCEDWDEGIQKAIATKRVLLLNNVDPELHSMELQEALSKFLETKCEVQKIIPNSFYYNTASALLKFMTPDIAQKSLQNLCKDCLMVGERTLFATLYEGLEFAKEIYHFHGHICIQPKSEVDKNCIEMDELPHAAQGNTIEFTFGLRWRLLQEQHELQWQLLNELHEKEFNLLNKETKKTKRLKKAK